MPPAWAPPEARFNRATLGVYELGSTFKPFTVAMAMDSGVIKSMGQMYNCPDVLNVYGQTVHDTHPFGRACSVAEIMKESSNIGTAQIADQVGATRQKAFLDKMGFLSRVGIELQGTRADADAGIALGSVRDHDGRFRPRHRRHSAAPGERLRDLVQWRHLPPRDLAQGRPQRIPPPRAAGCSPNRPATRCGHCFAWW